MLQWLRPMATQRPARRLRRVGALFVLLGIVFALMVISGAVQPVRAAEGMGTVILKKVTDPAGDPTEFWFQTDLVSYMNVLLVDGEVQAFDVMPGTYHVTEYPVAGWMQTSADCDNGDTIAEVHVGSGQTVTCTVVNTKYAQIVVDKVTDPAGSDQVFFYTISGADGNVVFSQTDAGAPFASDVLPGQYSLTESPAAGWALESVVCSDGSSPASIDMSAGEVVTCTFTNTQLPLGLIVLKKVTDPPGYPMAFTFYTDMLPWPVQLYDGQDTAFAVPGGTYHITESVAYGWTQTSAGCDNGDTIAEIHVDYGQTVTCTVTNTINGQILVDKVTDPAGSDQVFFYTLSGADGNVVFSQTDAGAPFGSEVLPGQYSLTESPAAGWALESVVCSDGSSPDSIDVSPGEIITCTFTNTQLPPGLIVLKKVTDPPGYPMAFTFYTDMLPWPVQLYDGQDTAFAVPGGTYHITESVAYGWTQTSAGCDNGDTIAEIHVDYGQTVTCTVTNTINGQILVDKVTNPSGSDQVFFYTLSGADGNVVFSQTDAGAPFASEVLPGQYSLTETPVAGWALDSAVCSDGSTPASIDVSPGEIITCTFTNAQKGRIIIDKVTNPAGSSENFPFTLTGGPANLNLAFTLTDAAAAYEVEVAAGQYAATEGTVTGWALDSAVCSDGSTPASIDVSPGEVITCTFTNLKVYPGHSKGYWANKNGRLELDPNKDGNLVDNGNDVWLGVDGQPRRFHVDTISESNKILGGNACAGGAPAVYAPCKNNLSQDVQQSAFNTMVAQTLALSYNIKLVPGFTGQKLSTLGCPVPAALAGWLSGSSTVNDALAVANQLISGSTAGGATTQAQVGAMTTLLDCLNREAP